MAESKIVEELSKMATENPLTIAVVGCAGQGKSTLVNSLLLMDCAEVGDTGKTVTTVVRQYTRSCKDGAKITVIDTPGFADSANVDPKPVLETLKRHCDDCKGVDLFLYCIAYHRGVRVDDSHRIVIQLLTEHFGADLWKKTRIVLTMVNTIESADRANIPELKANIESDLKRALRNFNVPEEITERQKIVLAGTGKDFLYISDKKKEDWNKNFFIDCLLSIGDMRKRANITHARYGKSFWKSMVATAITTGAAGAKVGVAVGTAVGPHGTVPGAVTGGIVGGAIGLISIFLIEYVSSKQND